MKGQRGIVLLVALMVLGSRLRYPPWYLQSPAQGRAGGGEIAYRFIFDPPSHHPSPPSSPHEPSTQIRRTDRDSWQGQLAWPRLLQQAGVLLLLTALGWWRAGA